ncbi:hypothetical protein PENTCL1PPCAC_16264, partial [Pristionchus entomophagus]
SVSSGHITVHTDVAVRIVHWHSLRVRSIVGDSVVLEQIGAVSLGLEGLAVVTDVELIALAVVGTMGVEALSVSLSGRARVRIEALIDVIAS